MVVDDSMVIYGCAHGDISSPLTWDVDNGTLTNNIPPPTPSFHQIESCFINIDELVQFRCCIQLQNTLKQTT